MNTTRVDALARLLDGDPTLNGEVIEETRVLGRLAHQLTTQAGRPAPLRPEFKAALRAALVEAAREQGPAPALLTRLRERIRGTAARWRYSSRVAAATGATALALSGGGMAAAADQAQPGDVLYPTKLVLEDMRMTLVRDDAARGQRHLAHAVERIEEAEAAASRGNQAGAAEALHHADESARTGAGDLIRSYQADGDRAHVAQLAEFAGAQRDRLAGLRVLLAGDAVRAARDLAVALERIEARMLAVTGTCAGCAGGPGGGGGFDFATIPPAGEDFVPCRCELPAPATGPTPAPGDSDETAPADSADPAPPPSDEEGGTPPVDHSVDPPTSAPSDQPDTQVPRPGERDRDDEPTLPRPSVPDSDLPEPSPPEERAPLTGPTLDRIIDAVLDGATSTLDR